MSQPFDWSFTQPYDEGSEEETPLAPPPAPKKVSRPPRSSVESKKEEAREKLTNYESLLDASRFLTTSLQAMAVCAREDVARLDKRKPRAPKASEPAPAAAPAAAPTASQAASACEEAVVGKNRLQGLKRVRTAVPEGPIGAEGGGRGAGAGAAMYNHAFQGRPRAASGVHTGVHTGVLGYKTE